MPPGLKTLLNGMLSVDPAQRLTIDQVAGAVAAPTTWSPPPPPPPPPAAAAAFRSLSAADDEAEEPRYNACGASAAYRSAPADDEDFLDAPAAAHARERGHAHPRLKLWAFPASREPASSRWVITP